jgi:hypothetical protein
MNIEKKSDAKNFIWKLRIDWEKNFPEMTGEWTHYQIIGDSEELKVINVLSLSKALDVVEENFDKYNDILVHRAKIDTEKGGFVYETNNSFQISNYKNAKVKLKMLTNFHNTNSIGNQSSVSTFSVIGKLSFILAIGLTFVDLLGENLFNITLEHLEPWLSVITYSCFIVFFFHYFLSKKQKNKKTKPNNSVNSIPNSIGSKK